MAIKLSTIKPNPENPRVIKDDKFAKLVQSIKDFPEMLALRPIVVDSTNTVLGGNMRIKALQEAGYTEVPDEWIKQASELTDEQKREFIIKDNVGFGEWDWEVLVNEWDEELLTEWGLDIPDFPEKLEAEENEDDIPEVTEAITEKGDLWELNNHRLLCGDSCNVEDIDKLMNGQKADCIFTDPPYEMDNFNWVDIVPVNNSQSLIMCSDKQVSSIVKRYPGELKRIYTLDTGIASPTNNDVYVNHIVMLRFASGEPPKFNNIHNGGRSIVKIQYRKNLPDSELHPHAKPVSLYEQFLLYWTSANKTVVDVFWGSGTCLIASEKNNRNCYLMEFEPKHCDITIKRWINYMNEHQKLFEIKRNGEKIDHQIFA